LAPPHALATAMANPRDAKSETGRFIDTPLSVRIS
jgi:hypothetical protein